MPPERDSFSRDGTDELSPEPPNRWPILAFLLSFLVPGAGLLYIGLWKWALINFGAYLALAVLTALLLPPDLFVRHVRTISMSAAALSAIIAHFAAVRRQRTIRWGRMLREFDDEEESGEPVHMDEQDEETRS